MKKLPKIISDGRYDYKLIRKARKNKNGTESLAIYERIPPDKKFVFTPDIAFINGITTMPLMFKLDR